MPRLNWLIVARAHPVCPLTQSFLELPSNLGYPVQKQKLSSFLGPGLLVKFKRKCTISYPTFKRLSSCRLGLQAPFIFASARFLQMPHLRPSAWELGSVLASSEVCLLPSLFSRPASEQQLHAFVTLPQASFPYT